MRAFLWTALLPSRSFVQNTQGAHLDSSFCRYSREPRWPPIRACSLARRQFPFGAQARECLPLAHLSSQGRHVVASKGGHWIQLEQPDLVIESIREVVESVGRKCRNERKRIMIVG